VLLQKRRFLSEDAGRLSPQFRTDHHCAVQAAKIARQFAIRPAPDWRHDRFTPHHAIQRIRKISHEVAAAAFAVGENINAGGSLDFDN